jgi:hypothetical protein
VVMGMVGILMDGGCCALSMLRYRLHRRSA